jgi:D-alanyl-D-alanine carboxypeptidase (penicillin-binding protein 5/6)
MLASGNDAAVAISIHISQSVEEFVKLMNVTAKKIGANNTSFETPNGLDGDNHYTTAYDLALITRYALNNKDFKEIVKTSKITIDWDGKDYGRTLTNHNKLLKTYDGATGVKTGFTKKSGRCLVSSAKKDGTEVVAVTLNCPNDWVEHTNMLNFAFENYKTVRVIKKGDYAKSFDVDFSDVKSVRSEFLNDVYVLVNKNEKNDFLIKYETETRLRAPVNFNQKTGTAKVILNGNVVGKTDIVTKCGADEKEIKRLSYEFKNILIKYIQGV